MFGAPAVCGLRAMARLKAFNARKTITLYYNCEEVAETLYVPLILKGEIMKTKITPILPVILIFCLAIGLSAQTKTGGEGIKRKAKTSAPARAPAKKPAAKTSPAPAPAAAVKKTEISSAAVITETPFETASKESKSINPALRRQGADRFGQLRDPNAIPRLIELLNDPTGYIRAAAVDSLGLLRGGGDKATAKLCEMLAGDPMKQSGKPSRFLSPRRPEKEDCLVKAVNDKSCAVRYAAIRTIGTLRFLNAESELIKLVDSEDLQTRGVLLRPLAVSVKNLPGSDKALG